MARSLLKNLKNAQTGRLEKLNPQFKYLAEDMSEFELEDTFEAVNNSKNLLRVFEKSIYYHTVLIGMDLLEKIKEGTNPLDIFNYKLGHRISQIGRLHGLYMVCKNFQTALDT